MSMSPAELADALLSAAKAAGAPAADALVADGQSVSIEVSGGKLEKAEREEAVEFGLRVILGKRQACVSSSDPRPETLKELAERAVAMAGEAPEDPHIGLAEPGEVAQSWDLASLDLNDDSPAPSPAALQETAHIAEAAALAVEGVTQVEEAGAYHSTTRIHLAASNGFSGGYTRSSHALSAVAISGTGTGMERDYYADARTYGSDMESAGDIGRLAGERAIAMQGARQPVTGTYPVLFDERIAASLIGHLLAASNGAAVARGATWLKDALGTAVLPEALSLQENPLKPRSRGSRPFDAEGLTSRPRDIVEAGVLTEWTLDLATARKLGMTSTASAARGTGAPPSPSVTNVMLTQGTASRDDLLRDMGTGLLITSMIGSTINPNTGDYSRGASGFWVEDGEIAYPVNECTVAGNLRDMLLRIVPANDARLHLSRAVPSLLIDGMTLAGA